MTLSFALSDLCLLAVQASLVAAVRPGTFEFLTRLRSRWWALVPLGSIVGVIFAIRAASDSASTLTYLALIAVPPLAAVGAAYVMRGHRPALALGVAPLFALAWFDRSGLAGQAAAVTLSALACVTLAAALAAVAPLGWLKLGVVAMSIADTVLVVAQQLQAPNDTLNAAAPAAGLPQLQRALFGSALMGFGDLFLAALLGAIIAAQARPQKPVVLLVFMLAVAFDLLFFVVDLLPATVPVALALIITEARPRFARLAARASARPPPPEPAGGA